MERISWIPRALPISSRFRELRTSFTLPKETDPFLEKSGKGVSGLHLHKSDFFNICRWKEASAQLPAHRRGSFFGKTIYNFIIF